MFGLNLGVKGGFGHGGHGIDLKGFHDLDFFLARAITYQKKWTDSEFRMGVAPEKLVAKNGLAKLAAIVPTPHVELQVFTDLSFRLKPMQTPKK